MIYLVFLMVVAFIVTIGLLVYRSGGTDVVVGIVKGLLIGVLYVIVVINIFNRDLELVAGKLQELYVIHHAYDDNEFDYGELKIIERWMDDDKLFAKLTVGDLTDRDEEKYVEFVTESVSHFDSSPDHLLFKIYVFQEDERRAGSGDADVPEIKNKLY